MYAQAGIVEYWIADLQANQIESHRHPEGNIFKNKEILRSKDEVKIHSLDLSFQLHQILEDEKRRGLLSPSLFD